MTDVDRTAAHRVLDLPLDDNGAGAPTVRAYLIALLSALWRAETRFSGNHPFGA